MESIIDLLEVRMRVCSMWICSMWNENLNVFLALPFLIYIQNTLSAKYFGRKKFRTNQFRRKEIRTDFLKMYEYFSVRRFFCPKIFPSEDFSVRKCFLSSSLIIFIKRFNHITTGFSLSLNNRGGGGGRGEGEDPTPEISG